jgi:DNA sulfur modification protein DndD
MRLIELTMTNFMPYFGRQEILFPKDKDKNVMLVFGDNMRGKTSVLNAIRWAFYGKALGRHSREIPLQDLVNKQAALEGNWSIETNITFEADGSIYEYRRKANKRALVATPSRPEDFEQIRGLKRDGQIIGDHLVDAEINKFAPEQTSRFFLFDGELLQEYESLLIDGSEQGRKIKTAIEQALGVPTLIGGRDDATTICRMAMNQQTKDLEKLSGLEKQAERQAAIQRQIESIEADIKNLQERLKVTFQGRTELDDFIDKRESIYQAKEKLNGLLIQRKDNLTKQEDYNKEKMLLVKDVWRDIVRPHIDRKRSSIHEKNQRLTEQVFERRRLEMRLMELQSSLIDATCPSCGQQLHSEQKAKAQEEIETIKQMISSNSIDETELHNAIAVTRELDHLLRPGPASEIAIIDREASILNVTLTKIENEIEKLQDSIKGHDTAEIARNRSRRDELVKEEARIEKDIREARYRLEQQVKESNALRLALERFPAARETRSSQLVKLAGLLEEVFKRSIEQLRDDMKTRVESLASKAFKTLSTQKKYAGLKINSNYGLAIIDELGQEVTVRSAGAEQIVALSLIDGLARAGKSAGPVVMDTPFGRLDLEHRNNILGYLPTAAEQLILLVHEGEINRTTDVATIAHKIGSAYEIREVNPRYSRIERVTQ